MKKEVGELIEDNLVANLREYATPVLVRAITRLYLEQLTFDGDGLGDQGLLRYIEDKLENNSAIGLDDSVDESIQEEHLILVLTAFIRQNGYDKANLDAAGFEGPPRGTILGMPIESGIDEDPDTEESLCVELEGFCRNYNLPYLSADELLHEYIGNGPDNEIVVYLKNYIKRWDDFHSKEG